MPSFTDQLGRTISLTKAPERIVSLVPSQTELLHTLGLGEEVVGITKFCVHPSAWSRSKTRVGGTKDVRPEKIHALQPDLIIANKEENVKEQIDALSHLYPVWVSDVRTLPEALDMIGSLGELTGKDPEARNLTEEIARRFDDLHLLRSDDPHRRSDAPNAPVNAERQPRTAYFIWRNPWMVAGGDTFIHDMLRRCGLDNLFGDRLRYPSINLEYLAEMRCERVLLSSEPYPFAEKHILEIRAVLPDAKIQLVDGEMFSWYGSRLLDAPLYFRRLAAMGKHLENPQIPAL